MSTLNIQLLCRKSKNSPKFSLFASWPGAMINSQWLKLSILNKYLWSQRCSSHWSLTVFIWWLYKATSQAAQAVFSKASVLFYCYSFRRCSRLLPGRGCGRLSEWLLTQLWSICFRRLNPRRCSFALHTNCHWVTLFNIYHYYLFSSQ